MTISYLSYTTGDHPPNYQSFITILIFRKKVAHYMILLKLLSCIKASFSLQKRRDILMNLRAITLLPLSYSIAVCDIPNFFQQVGGYENIEIVERIHLKFLKHMYILNIKSRTPYHIWFLIMEKPEGLHCLSIFILEWFQSGRNFSRPRKIKLFIYCTNNWWQNIIMNF